MPTATRRSMIDIGISRTPVAMADSPSATVRYNDIRKNRPSSKRNWKKKASRPARRCTTLSSTGSTSGSRPWLIIRCSQPENAHSNTPPPSISQNAGDRPTTPGPRAWG